KVNISIGSISLIAPAGRMCSRTRKNGIPGSGRLDVDSAVSLRRPAEAKKLRDLRPKTAPLQAADHAIRMHQVKICRLNRASVIPCLGFLLDNDCWVSAKLLWIDNTALCLQEELSA